MTNCPDCEVRAFFFIFFLQHVCKVGSFYYLCGGLNLFFEMLNNQDRATMPETPQVGAEPAKEQASTIKLVKSDPKKLISTHIAQVQAEATGQQLEPSYDANKDELYQVDKDFLDPFQPLPPQRTYVTIAGRRAIPVQGAISISAKPKCGKSTATRAMLIPIITGQKFANMEPTGTKPKLVLVFDTEMNNEDLCFRTKALRKQLGADARRYQISSLIGKTPAERVEFINAKIEKYRPDIVVIDQVAMLVHDYNNESEATKFKEWLINISKERAVWCIIHQNKAVADDNLKGHLGSCVAEACLENYTITCKNKIFEVKPKNSRITYVDENTEPMRFTLADNGTICDPTEQEAKNKEMQRQEWAKLMQPYFGTCTELRYSELQKRIMETESLSEPQARRRITDAITAGALIKTDPNNSKAPYKLYFPAP